MHHEDICINFAIRVNVTVECSQLHNDVNNKIVDNNIQ